MIHGPLPLLVLLSLLWSTPLVARVTESTETVYVSASQGSDTANDGASTSSPLQTLSAALSAASKFQASTVLLSGEFVLREAVWVTFKNAGVTLDQWPGQPAAVISGGYDLAANVTQNGEVWSVELPEPVADALAKMGQGDIYVNGESRRIVHTDTLKWEKAANVWPRTDDTTGLVYQDGDIDSSWDLANIKMWRVAAFHSWVKSYHSVKAVFPSNRTILFNKEAKFAYGTQGYCELNRFYIEGAPEMDLTPGTWRVLPKKQGVTVLEYLPAQGESFPPQSMVVPIPPSGAKQGALMSVMNTNDITLQNLGFQYSYSGDCDPCDSDNAAMADSALFIQSSSNVRLVNLTFRHVGGLALGAKKSDRLWVERASVQGCGAGGISVGASDYATVTNSIVAGYGVRYPAGVGISVTSSRNGTISHCDVSGGLHTGLSAGGNDDSGAYSTVEFNHVHDIGHETDDGICDYGGFHFGTTGSVLPLYMTSNIFHSITAFQNGGSGIYMDVSSQSWQVTRNLVHNVSNVALLWNVQSGTPEKWDAEPLRVVNNVFVANRDNAYYQEQADKKSKNGRGNEAIKWNGHTQSVFERNVIVVDPSNAPSRRSWWDGNPCAKEQTEVAGNCTYSYEDNFALSTVGQNVWFNVTGGSSDTYPGGCGSQCKSNTHPTCTCNSFEQWKSLTNQDIESVIQVDPMLKLAPSRSGALLLVTNPDVLEPLKIDPLTELADAGADWTL